MISTRLMIVMLVSLLQSTVYAADQGTLNRSLIRAIGNKNRRKVEECIVKGAQVTAKRGEDGVLHCAAEAGDESIFKYLLERIEDADVINAKNEYGETALHKIIEGNADFIPILVRKGADVNARDAWESTPLHDACQIGNFDAVQALIECGADPEATDDDNNTPLDIARREGHSDIIDYIDIPYAKPAITMKEK